METAMKHADLLNVSVWNLEKSNRTWVLSRQYLERFHTPRLGDEITIRTQPAGFDRLFTYRDFEIWNEPGALIAQSSSSWIMFDLGQRKRISLPETVQDILHETSTENPLARPLLRISLQGKVIKEKTFEVGYYHLDFNSHMSNLFYPEWILEPLGAGWLFDHEMKRMDIMYQSESNVGDKIISSVLQVEDLTTGHQLKNLDGRKVLSAQINWCNK